MASRLPALTGKEVIRALRKVGFVESRQRGSHVMLVHPDRGAKTVVPIHAGKTIKRPLLRAIIADAGISRQEFLALL